MGSREPQGSLSFSVRRGPAGELGQGVRLRRGGWPWNPGRELESQYMLESEQRGSGAWLRMRREHSGRDAHGSWVCVIVELIPREAVGHSIPM